MFVEAIFTFCGCEQFFAFVPWLVRLINLDKYLTQASSKNCRFLEFNFDVFETESQARRQLFFAVLIVNFENLTTIQKNTVD